MEFFFLEADDMSAKNRNNFFPRWDLSLVSLLTYNVITRKYQPLIKKNKKTNDKKWFFSTEITFFIYIKFKIYFPVIKTVVHR